MMQLTETQRFHLKKFIKDIENFRGRHTELISVYVPQGYDLNKIINHLAQEQGTATNIKSTATRKNVTDGLERMIQHLRLFKKTPDNGLVCFSGNVSEREGGSDVQVWSMEPPIPLKTRIYRCDKEFVLDILRDMLDTKEMYGLVVIDRRDANLAVLKGKTIIPQVKTHSEVPGKFKAGGQCLVQDSMVQLSDGIVSEIKFLHNPHKVKSVMVSKKFKIQDSNITDKWNTKKSTVYKIVTKNPRLEIETSKDHVFFVSTSEGIIEKPAEELKKSDLLVMPEKIDVKGSVQKLFSKQYYSSFTITQAGQKLLKKSRQSKKLHQKQLAKKVGVAQTTISSYEIGKLNINKGQLSKLCKSLSLDEKDFLNKHLNPVDQQGVSVKLPRAIDESFAQFLGYFVGDGCLETDRITLFEQREEVAKKYKKKFDRYFNLDASYRFRESKNYHQLRYTSRPLVRLLRGEFPELKKAKDTLVPTKISQSSNRVVAKFLQGFFDAEGYVNKTRGVSLGINNKKLAHQLQLLLLRFSIISSIHEYDNRRNPYSSDVRYTVDIGEKESLELFEKHINFSSTEKSEILGKIALKKSENNYTRQIIESGSKIRALVEKYGYKPSSFPTVTNFFRNGRMMSKAVFKRSILSKVKKVRLVAKLKEILNYPVLPVAISKIEKSVESVQMSDISVKDQNFIANGLLVHNSAARFSRLREGAAKDHYKKVAEYMKEQFHGRQEIKGIIVGGPGPTKHEFIELGQITQELKDKIIAVKDLSYTGEFGLQELLEKSEDVLASEEVMAEKKIMGRFFQMLSTNQGTVSYGEQQVMSALQQGAVETLLLSESLPDEKIVEFEEEAQKVGSELKIISTETREGAQLNDMGKIAAILRYEVAQ